MKFLLLLRPVNLLIIALTMYITKIYIVEAILTGSFLIELADIYDIPPNYELNFFLLVLMMVLLAAGGNIINDYFDVRADRINKPHKTYIDYHVKRKWAVLSHIAFTILAVLISFYLWMATSNSIFVMSSIGIALLLWFYSLILKKKFIIGNITIAILTASVPMIAYFYFTPIIEQYPGTSLDFTMGSLTLKLTPYYDVFAIVGIFSGFAFISNFIREIVKDISDIVGDKRVGCKTMPIVLGVVTTKVILILLILLLLSLFTFPFLMYPKIWPISLIVYPLLLIILLLLGTILSLLTAKSKEKYGLTSLLLKLVMLVGIVLPIILNYGTNDN